MAQKTLEQPVVQTEFRLRRQGTWTYEDWLNFPDDGWKYEIIAVMIAQRSLRFTRRPGVQNIG